MAVVAIGGLDEVLRALEEPGHVRREAGVVAGDADVAVTPVAGRLEGLVHGLVGRRALRPAVVGDLHRHPGLLGEARRHRLLPIGVVAEGEQLVAAHLWERGARIEVHQVLERARAWAVRIDPLVVDRHLEPGEVPGGEQHDRGSPARTIGIGRRRGHRHQDDTSDHGHCRQSPGEAPRALERLHRSPPSCPLTLLTAAELYCVGCGRPPGRSHSEAPTRMPAASCPGRRSGTRVTDCPQARAEPGRPSLGGGVPWPPR